MTNALDLPGYHSNIVQDSIGYTYGQRITTFETKMPKWLVAEFNTHRMLSRNSASSRAIPTKQIIERVMVDPVIPVDFRSKNTGMVADTVLSDEDYEAAKRFWLLGRDAIVAVVEQMMKIGEGIDKQRINRLLEPWMWTVVVSTATEWENFFFLRDSVEAQPEFAVVARNMSILYSESKPRLAAWHFPYIEDEHITDKTVYAAPILPGLKQITSAIMHASAGRCGRVSYYRQGTGKSIYEDVTRGVLFAENKHWSPLEHTAKEQAWKWYGNLFTWKPLRKYYSDESGMTRKVRLNAISRGRLHAKSTS